MRLKKALAWPPEPLVDPYTPEERDVRGAFLDWFGADLDANARDFARFIWDILSPSWRRQARRDVVVKFGVLMATANASPAHRAALRSLLADSSAYAVTPAQLAIAREAFNLFDVEGEPPLCRHCDGNGCELCRGSGYDSGE